MAENRTLPIQFSRTFYEERERHDFLLNYSSQQPKKILKDKQNQLNRTIIPIKEYSNKFLRSSKSKSRVDPPGRKLNTQQRFNVILKKKNVINKNALKQNSFRLEQQCEGQQEKQALMKVSSLCKPRKENQIKTEASVLNDNTESNFSHFEMLESSLYNLIAPTSNLLNPAKSRFFEQTRKQNKRNRNRSISIQNLDRKDKISQSRGLQLFSKIFVRNKDEIIEKIQKKIQNQRDQSKFYETQQNFETRKITPIQKCRKAKVLIETYRPKKKSMKKYYTIENCEEMEEIYELNGWQTTI